LHDLLLVRSPLHEALDERMFGREDGERGAVEGVGARREDRDVDVELLDPKDDLRPFRAPDPVALHREHALGPGLEHRHVVQEPVGVGGDPEEPLLQRARLDLPAAALAMSVDHLLVREHGLVVWTPVDDRALAVCETRLEELEEEPLRPVVVVGLCSRELTAPVDRPPEALHLLADRGDVPVRDVARVLPLADGGVLGRETERVVADRPQHREAAPPADVRDDVSERVVEDVAHVQLARRRREHLEHVRVLPRRIVGRRVRDDESAFALPFGLPLGLDRLRVVPVHQRSTRLAPRLAPVSAPGRLVSTLWGGDPERMWTWARYLVAPTTMWLAP